MVSPDSGLRSVRVPGTRKNVHKEKLDVREAYHLWDHITQRYDQIQLTEFFVSFTHDAEYTAILNSGIDLLNDQVERICRVMLGFEIPLPKRPPVSVKTPIDPETLEDVFTYRTLLRGIQESVDLHLRTVAQSTRNDSLRHLFSDFFAVELDLHDKFVKYGKMKGWIHTPPPIYFEPS